jgi:hypothetical protein
LNTLVDNLAQPSNRVLEPTERISEILFALIMVLTFTCSFSVADAGRAEVRTMLIGALGCNVAWGIIDGVFYLMSSFSEFGQRILKLKALRQASSPFDAHQIIAHALPPVVASILSTSELEGLRQKLTLLPEPPSRPKLQKGDFLGAFAVFLIILLTTLPVVMPFALIEDVRRALRVSNGIALVMLFLAGYAFGRYAGHRPLAMGVAMVVLGGGLVAITIVLGG